MKTMVKYFEFKTSFFLLLAYASISISAMADSFVRKDSAVAGAISRLATAWVPGGHVTAVRDSNNNLKIIGWTNLDGQIQRRGEASAGEINLLAIAGISGFFVTAVTDSNAKLKLIAWGAPHQLQTLTRDGDASAGAVSRMAITLTDSQFPVYRAVTAVRDSNGNLKLIAWDIDRSSGSAVITRRGSATAGAVSEISIATVRGEIDLPQHDLPQRVATVVRDTAGNLKVIAWDIDQNGNIHRRGSASAGAVSLVSASRLQVDRILTGVRDRMGELKVIVWDFGEDGSIHRRGSAGAGAVSLVDTNASTTAVRDSNGNLKIIRWAISNDGSINREGDGSAGKVSLISDSPGGRFTAVRDSNGDLKVISWNFE